MASFLTKLLPFIALVVAEPSLSQRAAPGVPLISNKVLFTPPSDYRNPRTLYARTVELTQSQNTLLATWENYSPEPPHVYFPILSSTDHGASWTQISKVTDQVNGWGLRYQPFLYELEEAFAGFPKGTVLLAGNSIPTDQSETKIDLYASKDAGHTWKFVSHIAAGGEALPNNGLTPVWEPFIMLYNKQLVVYYSDQRLNATYGQRMVHQTSTDGLKWGPVVADVEYPVYEDRPGMPIIAQLPNRDYIMTYEYGHTDPATGKYSFPVTYRINSNPLKFSESKGIPIVAKNTGTAPTGSPYVVWSPVGGKDGTLIVSSGDAATLFTNTALGAAGEWYERKTSASTSYSRHLRVFQEDQDKLLIMAGGKLPTSPNDVSYSILSIAALSGA
ncbi:unnamed protein product [Discula destructiva]